MEHKRKRLSYACNFCRQRKTRCDEEHPSCRNCRVAGVQCITTDKRHAGVIVTSRRRISSSPSTSTALSTATGAAATPVEKTVLRTPVSLSQASPLPAASPGLRPPTQCWDRTGWRSGRLPMMPRFLGGCMFEIMTEWLDLAFYRLRIPAPYPAPAQLAASASVPVSVLQSAPDLPPGQERRILSERFLQTVCSVFPFVSASEVYSLCDPRTDTAWPVSGQALAYLIAATALMAGYAQPQSAPAVYLSYCNSLLGHMVAERSRQAVQAILLLAIALRSCDQIAWAWDILGLGVSMAQSIGINQTHSEPDSTWWCLYVFEKILAFESGRASMIWDRELLRPVQVAEEDEPGKRYRQACISLANMLHELQDRAAGAWRREEWLPQTVDEAIKEKVHTGGELATLLEEWWECLPAEYRTGPFSQQSAFLTFYYRYALILLNRSVLLIEKSEIREVTDRYASGKPWQHRLINGAGVCVEAAREMVKLTVAMVDSGCPTYLTALTSPLSAVYALAVHIFRERNSLLVRSDFEYDSITAA
ncbi:hypothetical protein AN7788.2 [Aspergillus nidulans FGSC A4]|uniref:Zn(II)2Cys6 transcription factor (Eurofung) n=1 Tax=Emericella nidulans (strain FGSC A4 / ATCC 38163 / CBS 112.46 / NRRL 194 / M139) TaxID=227321 RepID=Q5AV92_EMENI|nr:hypothetical protein [Aspergillus nidulans FGSC A4]EAA61576.1 hypothetical protein AN7788.2 [Aspergillus nidulans FGSC A4]CBF80108.1 TPA: Putative Zn(II)2Cys6 transcription factor (Eurofung) [Aspergillus nidulans FGSC A4]|eukprot:XP_681057.1 hypothetical protein AN7788.2 [Aspergillus nidulans FGSC A4]